MEKDERELSIFEKKITKAIENIAYDGDKLERGLSYIRLGDVIVLKDNIAIKIFSRHLAELLKNN
jgi:uncharacterized Zn finger protein